LIYKKWKICICLLKKEEKKTRADCRKWLRTFGQIMMAQGKDDVDFISKNI
jgi:hypothetical protein